MKKWAIYALLVFTVVFTGCKAINKLTQFYINYNTSYTYQNTLPSDVPDSINTPDIVTNIDQQVEINESRKDLIQSAKLNTMKLNIPAEYSTNFSFLKSVDLYISAAGQPKTLVAYKHNITDEIGNELELDLTDVELKNYIKNDVITLSITSTTDQFLSRNVQVNVAIKFFVDAKILGI